MTTTIRNLHERLLGSLRKLHANQSGAVAFMVLCAILIALMMALIVYDTTPIARQKIEVQTAADTSAWSQSAVEARSLNMIAFANVAKRIIMGQSMFYAALWEAWAVIVTITTIALIAAIVLCFFGVGCAFVDKLAITLANVATIMANEASDGGAFGLISDSGSIYDRTKEDMEALDNYQTHFQTLTPWWSWGEGWRRGLRNGAYVSGWPVPGNALSAAEDIPLIGSLITTGITDELPVERYPNFKELCQRSIIPDMPIHLADYGFQTLQCGSDCTTDRPSGGIPRAALYIAAGGLATGIYWLKCNTGAGWMNDRFSGDLEPFQLKEAEWLLTTSNLVFAYRPGEEMNDKFRDKYGFLSPEYETTLDLLYEPDGYLGMARSEVSFQDGHPDLWHTSWSARMRPVALPGEWAGYSGDWRMVSAFNDTVPYLLAGATIGGALEFLGVGNSFGGGEKMGMPDPLDLIKAEVAFDAMTDTYVDGVAR